MATERQIELISTAYAAGITSQRELANFMAQLTQESSGLTRLNESFIYSRSLAQVPVRSVQNHPVQGEAARLEALRGHPEKLAEMMYGGRMGNNEPGDGYKYRGRGYIQLTGKFNYRAAEEALGLDLLNNPDLAAIRENAVKVSIWFWMKNVHNIAPEDIDRATEIINVGKEGIDQRRKYFADWQDKLTPDVMEGLALGEMRLPIEQQVASHEINAIDHSAKGVLKTGDRNAAVDELQTHLNNLGYTGSQGRALIIDQDFGHDTRYAVETFQHNQHLHVDGVVGPNTWTALQEATRAAAIAPTMVPAIPKEPPSITFPQMAPPPDLDTTAIRTLQQHLNTLHLAEHRHQALSVTGAYDDATRTAVMDFQQSQGLPSTGVADPAIRGLIEARATIVEMQQSANRHAVSTRETSLLEMPIQAPNAPSVTTPSQPSAPVAIAPPHRVAPASPPTHGVGYPPPPAQTIPEPAASPVHHPGAANQDALAVIQAQLQAVQRQMEAMNREREQEREKERTREASRATPNDPAQRTPREARSEQAAPPHAAQPLSYSNPDHPQHALYARLKELLPQGTSEARLAQSTSACYMGQFRRPEQLDEIHIVKGAVLFLSTRPDVYASIDMTKPAPNVEQTMKHAQGYDQQQAQWRAQFEEQQREINVRGGPTLH
jgi:putative chitinase